MVVNSGVCVVADTVGAEPVERGRVLQVALCSEGVKGIKAGLRTFPVDKLLVIHTPQTSPLVNELLEQLSEALELETEAVQVSSPRFDEVLDVLSTALKANLTKFDDVYVNLSEGDKLFSCSALAVCFLFGVKAYYIMDDSPYVFPIVRLGYQKILPEAKLNILQVLAKVGGGVASLEELSELTGYDKAQLSYHINGAPDSRGLAALGLVSVEKGARGRLTIRLTTQGKILLMSGV